MATRPQSPTPSLGRTRSRGSSPTHSRSPSPCSHAHDRADTRASRNVRSPQRARSPRARSPRTTWTRGGAPRAEKAKIMSSFYENGDPQRCRSAP
eukprot:498767-Rhodomonas_salina.2